MTGWCERGNEPSVSIKGLKRPHYLPGALSFSVLNCVVNTSRTTLFEWNVGYITLRLVCRWSQIRRVYFLRFGWARANKATSLCLHLYPSIGASHSATGSRCMYDPLITCPLDDIGLSAVGLGSTNLGRSRSYWSDAPRHASTHSKAPPYLRTETPVAYHTVVDARPSLESNSSVASRIEPVCHVIYLWHI